MYSVRGTDRPCTCHYDASYHNSANAKYAVGSIILGLDDCTCQRSAIGFYILFLRHKTQLYGWPWLYEKYANYRGKQGGALTTWLVSSRQCRKTFAYVTQEMISTGQTAAFFIGQLLKNAAAVIVFCIATWFWNWQLGILLTLAIPVLFLLMKISQICVGKGNSLEEPAEQEIASRVVEFAKCQGALRACHVGADYEELKDSFVNSKKQSVRGLWWSALGQVLSGMGVQMLVAGMITFVSLLGLAGDMGEVL